MFYFKKIFKFSFYLSLVFCSINASVLRTDYEINEHRMHPTLSFRATTTNIKRHKRAMPTIRFDSTKPEEALSDYWSNIGQQILAQQLHSKSNLNTNSAKNVVYFLGDGMSIPTITAGRVYLGGEEQQFTFEKFPYIGLSKTYCSNAQVADSACTATAYLGGVKSNFGTIGVSAAVELNDCLAQNNTNLHVHSIIEFAQRHGMSTGFVTTTGVTHATPAGVYAHSANRNWENDAAVIADNGDPAMCPDIAMQLVHGAVGENLNVILGGGRQHFLPISEKDNDGVIGKRLDGRNLLKEWQQKHATKRAHIVQNKKELLALSTTSTLTTERLLGLFAPEHMPFHLEADADSIPTLDEMVSVALDILERQSHGKGFFLFVEGGRIDHAHHDTLAQKALDETAEFDKAIALAQLRTNNDDTLIVVTSDHAHTMSVAGYSSRKNDIFGINNGQMAADQLPYATLSYANGPGFEINSLQQNGAIKRKNLQKLNMKEKDYKFPSMVPLESETHGGDDVAVFATGPFSHLFTGAYEQNYIAHAVNYAACLGNKRTACTDGWHNERITWHVTAEINE